MADNYLEKRMDDYRRSRTGARVAVTARPRNSFVARMPAVRVLMLCTDPAGFPLRSVASVLSPCGVRVAFMAGDRGEGTDIAQSSGALYLPLHSISDALAELKARWGGIDMVIADTNYAGLYAGHSDGETRIVVISDSDCRADERWLTIVAADRGLDMALGQLCAFLALPAGHSVKSGQVIHLTTPGG